jgi:hypothetical protein
MNEPEYGSAAPVDRAVPNPWLTVGASLLVAALLILLSGISFSYTSIDPSFRERMEIISRQGAHIFTAVLVLAGVLALIPAGRAAADPGRIRLLFVLAFVVGIAVALLSLFSVWNISTADVGQFGVQDGGWDFRLGELLPRVASGVVGGMAMLIASGNAPATRR